MDDEVIIIEVAFAKPAEQVVVPITVSKGVCVGQAVELSGILERFPEIIWSKAKVGIFGKICTIEKKLKAGDRIEIYRPLVQQPMEARRNRAIKSR